MAGQYSESSRLSFPWSLFGGCFNHLFVARRLPRWVLVFAMDSTRFEVLETILKRSSNARVLVFAMDSASSDVLTTILKRSSNDPQMPVYWFLQWILQVLRFSDSNDPQTPAYWFLQWILQVLRFSERSSNKPQTILKRPRIGFCNGFYKFWSSQDDPQKNLKQTSNDPQTLAYWFLQWIL